MVIARDKSARQGGRHHRRDARNYTRRAAAGDLFGRMLRQAAAISADRRFLRRVTSGLSYGGNIDALADVRVLAAAV